LIARFGEQVFAAWPKQRIELVSAVFLSVLSYPHIEAAVYAVPKMLRVRIVDSYFHWARSRFGLLVRWISH